MKIRDILILEDAAEDMVAGRLFYDKQESGIGNYFWESILSDLESLKLYAGIHQRYFGLFRMLSKRFPYSIYYEVIEAVAYVIAVLPMRRDPAWIKDQIQNRR